MVKRGGCQEPTRDGSSCGMPKLTDSAYCFAHDPRRARDRAEARLRGGRNRRVARGSAPPKSPPRLRDVGAIQAQLEKLLLDTLQMENSAQRNRTGGTLLGIALDCLKIGEIETRLAALEAMVLQGPRRTA